MLTSVIRTSVLRRRWGTSVFGIVPDGARRRRPSDIARVILAVLVVGLTAAGASKVSGIEKSIYDLVTSLPSGLHGVFGVLYDLAGAVAVALLVVSVVARRLRLILTLALAGALAWAIAALLANVVDVADALSRAGVDLHGQTPDFPVVRLAAAAAVMLAAGPYLTRPARRLVDVAFWLAAVGAIYLAEGLPGATIGSLVLGWGAAAVAHLVVGSPAATPSIDQVTTSLRELDIEPEHLRLAAEQVWGRTSYLAEANGALLSIDVVGRDSTDARLFAKVWRFVWYKDSGPTLALSRERQVEHQAYVLLLAERTGAAVPSVVAAGVSGAREDALLVVRDPDGVAMTDAPPAAVTDDVLRDAWANLDRLHAARLAHGRPRAGNVVLREDGTTAFIDLTDTSTSASDDQMALDDVELLATTAVLVGPDRALGVARHALGDDRLAAALPLLESAALSSVSRRAIPDTKAFLEGLRNAGADLTGTDAPRPAELRRFSLGKILLAAATALGVYLLVGELAGVASMGDVFKGADWGWVAVVALLSQLPQFTGAIAMLGAVADPLPLKPVTVVQFAQAFTGLIGGTAANATLVIRFFQKRGLPVAVAVSSGVLNSLAGFITQIVLVVVGLAVTGSSFDLSLGSSGGVPSWVLWLLAIVGAGLFGALLVPKIRRRVRTIVKEQLTSAVANVRGILATPRKAVELFGGNLASQVLFAMTLGAALHAYGYSLPLLQLIVINSFASFIGGAAPVPGGLGVVEAGMIAGFTAAGIPQTVAVAATFTARMFTTYLPPIWGWFALNWLRRHDYV